MRRFLRFRNKPVGIFFIEWRPSINTVDKIPDDIFSTRYIQKNTKSRWWLTRDPIGYEGGENVYSYVLNNPVRYFDVNGTDTIDTVVDSVISFGDGISFGVPKDIRDLIDWSLGEDDPVDYGVSGYKWGNRTGTGVACVLAVTDGLRRLG